jgi:hypothetical protein
MRTLSLFGTERWARDRLWRERVPLAFVLCVCVCGEKVATR